LHAGSHARHFVLAVGFDLANGVVDSSGKQIFQHFAVIFTDAFKQSRINAHTLDVVTASHDHGDHIATRLAGDFCIGQFFLHLGHFFLHLLRLLHQAGHATFHHGNHLKRYLDNAPGIKTAPGCKFLSWRC